MKPYLDLMQKIIDNGTESPDRTKTGTIKIFGEMMHIPLDHFPLLTTKKMAFNSIVSELLLFTQPIADRRIMQKIQHGFFNPNIFDIWKGNCIDAQNKDPLKFNGFNMGNMYPVYWRRKPHQTLEMVLVKIEDPHNPIYDISSTEEYDVNDDPLNTDYMIKIWKSIQSNCSNRWKDYTNFLSDIRSVSGFFDFIKDPDEYELNCEYFGSELHNINTSIFLKKSLKKYILPLFEAKSCVEIDNKLYISRDAFMNTIEGKELKRVSDKIQCKEIIAPNGYIYRPQLFLDQLQQMIDDIESVKVNPEHSAGRRIIMDSWNQSWASDSVLGICHPWVQCFVHDDKLSMMFTMR